MTVLRILALAALLAAASCAGFVAPREAGLERDMTEAGAELDRGAAIRLVSAYRLSRGRGLLSRDAALDAVAVEHARAMARQGRLGHAVGGRDFDARMTQAGYRVVRAYENIGAGQKTLRAAFEGWQDSAAHRENMLKRGVSRMGIAAAPSPGRYGVYWVMIVAEPYAPPPARW